MRELAIVTSDYIGRAETLGSCPMSRDGAWHEAAG
jgi:hypothetical protein